MGDCRKLLACLAGLILAGLLSLVAGNDVIGQGACALQPCVNGGTCEIPTDGTPGYSCLCPEGFTGVNCEEDVTSCLNNECRNGATCVAGGPEAGTYSCTCPVSFTGSRCEVEINQMLDDVTGELDGEGGRERRCVNCDEDIDYCEPEPCQNEGRCMDSVTSFLCTCTEAWMGQNCTEPYDACASQPCRNNGSCEAEPRAHNYTCTCPMGFQGQLCEDNIDDCLQAACDDPRVCVDGVASYVCSCPAGLDGDNCDIEVDHCVSQPCQNGGTCMGVAGGYRCECIGEDVNHTIYNGDPAAFYRIGFSGVHCEIDVDECSYPGSICLFGGICGQDDDTPYGFRCYCPQGGDYYTGRFCEYRTDFCNIQPDPPACHNGGTCTDVGDKYLCNCVPGFTGPRCTVNINECASSPCLNNATCVDLVNGFFCDCAPGYADVICDVDINECQSSPCLHGTCVDQLNGYECNCTDTGYNGTFCELDVDDCAEMPCEHSATCVDGLKNYTCQCHPGYAGYRCEIDVPECMSNPCSNGGICQEHSHSVLPGFDHQTAEGYYCDCLVGFTGDHCETNIDDCVSAPCVNGNCTDGVAMYTCECWPGYTGALCETEIDECVVFMPCRFGSVCEDLVGDYSCHCPASYEGQQYGGKNCAIALIGCQDNQCANGATCLPTLVDEVQNVHNYTCQCPPGFTGAYCQWGTAASFVGSSWLRYNATEGISDIQMTFDLATTLPDAVLLVNARQNAPPLPVDYMTLTLAGGTRLEMAYKNALTNPAKTLALSTPNAAPLADGQWHRVTLNVTYLRLTLMLWHPDCVNGVCQASAMLGSDGAQARHHPLGVTYFGANAAGEAVGDLGNAPPFTGCLRDVTVLDDVIVPDAYIAAAGETEQLVAGCARTDQCSPDPCGGHGLCTDLWFDFQCACWRPYIGDMCNDSFTAATFGFEGSASFALFNPPDDNELRSTNNISFFFRTRSPNGLLFYLGDADTFVMSHMVDGALQIGVRFSDVTELFDVDGYYADGEQYYYNVLRSNDEVTWVVKRADRVGDNGGITGTGSVVNIDKYLAPDSFLFGGLPAHVQPTEGRRRRRRQAEGVATTAADAVATYLGVNDTEPLRGTLQDARQNDVLAQFFPRNDTGGSASFDDPVRENVVEGEKSDDVCLLDQPCQNNATCANAFFNDYVCVCADGFRGRNCDELDFCVYNECPGDSVCNSLEDGFECVTEATFDGATSFAQYSHTLNASTVVDTLFVAFRTREDGVLLHLKGVAERDANFLTVELTGGLVSVAFDLGSGPEAVSGGGGAGLQDAAWHNASVEVTAAGGVALAVDGLPADMLNASLPVVLGDLLLDSDNVFVGGVDAAYRAANPTKFLADTGVKGCLHQARIGGLLLPFYGPDLLANDTSVEKFSVANEAAVNNTGCYGDPVCDAHACENNATCVDVWNDYDCACLPGFNGSLCENDIDECLLGNECANGATCVDGIANYTCECAPGYTDFMCDTDIDECESSPCMNNGTCVDDVNAYQCNCTGNYTGVNCEINMNENCDYNLDLCLNNGTCTMVETIYPGVETFNCTCERGYTGRYCESEIDYCEGDPCLNNATCFSNRTIYDYVCSCVLGFTGVDCETNIDECASNPCQNNAICTDSIAGYDCSCVPGWEGPDCDIDIDECNGTTTGPCVHGTCVNTAGNFSCNCTDTGFEGFLCDLDIDECEVYAPCEHGANCSNVAGSYLCDCGLGYEGIHCQTANCSHDQCLNDGNCSIADSTWSCQCPEFVEGEQCEFLGPCVAEPCLNGDCSQQGDQYTCQCLSGWEGKNCSTDIDECTVYSPCQNEANCTNLEGDYECSCVAGWDGQNCTEDIDECLSNPCLNGAQCKDLINGYVCDCMGTGYNGTLCESDIDECLAFDICQNDGTCENTPGSFICTCLPGFLGNTCHSLDPCNATYCLNDANCTALVSDEWKNVSVVCACVDPWYGPQCEFTEPFKRPVEPDSNLDIIIGVVIAGVVLIVIIVIIVLVVIYKDKRATRGTYSPSRQEMVGSRVEMGNVLKPPPEERLI